MSSLKQASLKPSVSTRRNDSLLVTSEPEKVTDPDAVKFAELQTLPQSAEDRYCELTESTRLLSAHMEVMAHLPVTSPPQGVKVETQLLTSSVPDPVPPVPASFVSVISRQPNMPQPASRVRPKS